MTGSALSDGERRFLEALNQRGVRYLIVGMSAALLQGARGSTEDVDQRAHPLSTREAEVALLAAQGYTVLNMAHRLNVAESTVRTYLKRIYRKLQVCSRAELAWRVLGQ